MKQFFFILLAAIPVWAFAATQPPQAEHGTAAGQQAGVIRMIVPLKEIKGVVSWKMLAKVKQLKSKNRIVPEFSKDIAALNGKEVKLQGFMVPLEAGKKQTHFLLSVNSSSCSYCLPAGPEGVVEVKSKTPVKHTFEPIVLSGKMAVLRDDPMGLYYRLTNAEPASVK